MVSLELESCLNKKRAIIGICKDDKYHAMAVL